MKNQILKFITILVFVFTSFLSYSQLGIVTHTDEVQDGYVLFKEPGGGFTSESDFFLINSCGQLINTWTGDIGFFLHAKLLPNGNLMFFSDETIFEKNWDNEIVNQVELQSTQIVLDYEVIKLENGNYLSVGRKNTSVTDFGDNGWNFELGQPLVTDVVIEIDSSSGEILWEWDIFDHVVQERDSSLGNYGVVADHPELLNLDAISTVDWTFDESFMINGFDYNPDLEQVMLSVRKMSEVIVIDRTTTTEEAASHSGGLYGKGGDILFRWGNPSNYNAGDEDDRKLYFQHNPKWITQGPNVGKISMFNNGLDRSFDGSPFSEAPVVDTQVDSDGNYSLDDQNQYASGDPFFCFKPNDPIDYFYSQYLSGVEHMSNGNAYFTDGESSKLLELNDSGDIVWQFNIPFTGFRTEKYPADYSAFANVDVTPGDYLPYTSIHPNCVVSNTKDIDLQQVSVMHFQNDRIEVSNQEQLSLSFSLLDSQGRVHFNASSSELTSIIELDHLSAGFYMLLVLEEDSRRSKRHSFIQLR